MPLSVVFEEAREKIPMAVDDPGEHFMPAGPDKQVKWLILLKVTGYRQISDGWRSWGGVGGS